MTDAVAKPAGKARKPRVDKLSQRERRFCSEYVVDLNQTQAAIRSGYSPKTAASQASRLLKRVKIQEALSEFKRDLAADLEITPKRVLKEWAGIAFANMSDYTRVTEDGAPIIDLSKCTREQMAALSETQTEQIIEVSGEQAVRKVKIKCHSKPQALEALSKHLGLFEVDNLQKQVVEHKIVLFGSTHDGSDG